MGDDKNRGPLFPVSAVAIILAALGITMFTQPFKGTRPFVPELREPYEKVNARLWQDPFRAVLDSVKTGQPFQGAGKFDITQKGRDKQKGDKLQSLTSKREDKDKKRITVLGVMVPGAPYSEDTEFRMRMRYAVLSGLSRVGFIPEDPEHIEFIQITTSDNSTLSNIMPVEWLTRTEKKVGDSVLVLWINDNFFQKSPLSYLSNLAEYLELPKVLKESNERFKIIGPATSTTLKEMVKEVFDTAISKQLNFLEGTEIYSAMATVNNTLLHKDNDKVRNEKDEELPEVEAQDKIINQFDTCGITFKRTIGSDYKLAKELVRELELRRVNLKGKKDKPHFVLVSEWDTYYGRSFHNAFRTALKKNDVAPDVFAEQVHRISYLRGIDGSLPGEKEDKKDDKAEAESDPLKNIKNLEQPTGKSQYDYLRRLAEETYHFDQDLKANRKGEIKAIGVLGTDFYDKYLVLQALRQRFPDVIFFTTDLDARFLHPDNIKWTRNLVVASNFGLSLRKDPDLDIQGEVPPFRDNYQTSVFFTVLQAFKDELSLKRNENDQRVSKAIRELNEKKLQPLIFEIGRRNAVALTDSVDTIHPRKNQFAGSVGAYVKIGVILLSAFFFFFFTSAHINNFVRQLFRAENKRYVMASICGVFLIIFFVVAIYLFSNPSEEEPFSLFEGISVWPTEIFRLIAISLSILFLYWSWRNRKNNTKDINTDFVFNNSKDNVSKTGIRNKIKNVLELDWKPGESNQKISISSSWFDYISHDSDYYHVWRVIIIAIFYISLCSLIISFDMPVSPARGPYTFWIDKVLIIINVALFILLISYVFDVTRCCRKFITILSEKCSKISDAQSDVPIQVQIDNQLTFVRLIAMRTEAVGKLIFYPLIVWLVMFVSRFDYFDNWRTPTGLAVVVSLGALYAWSCAFLLRRSAEYARTCAEGRLKKLLFNTLKEEKPSSERIKQIESVLDEVRSIRQGAFAPFTQNPVVQSLLVPFGGVGGIYLIEFLTKMNI